MDAEAGTMMLLQVSERVPAGPLLPEVTKGIVTAWAESASEQRIARTMTGKRGRSDMGGSGVEVSVRWKPIHGERAESGGSRGDHITASGQGGLTGWPKGRRHEARDYRLGLLGLAWG